MQSYIFLDLDDTLFQTLRKCEYPASDPRLIARAYLKDGSPNSYATNKQQWLWDYVDKGFKIVPVTGRDSLEFNRVTLPFAEDVVLNHGAVILNKHRAIDTGWMVKMKEQLPEYDEKLLVVWKEIDAYCKQSVGYKMRLVTVFDITWFGVIKHVDATEKVLQLLLHAVIINHPYIVDGSLYWHLNGNNLAVLPKIIKKEHAVSYLMARYKQQYPELITLGAGDSYTDAAFMSLCDYALVPKNTQLFKRLTVN